MKNILTIDTEDWFHASFLDIPKREWRNCENRISSTLHDILSLLRETRNKATFFTVAWVAEQYPELIQEIVSEGHELALHGYSHRLITEQTPTEFEEDLKLSLKILASITDQKIRGFRAPSWSINNENKDSVVEILAKYGFLYDSSIFPFSTFLYGDSTAPIRPNILATRNGNTILEVPPSVIDYGPFRIPFAGGFYFRVLPYKFIMYAIKRMNKKGYPAVLYLHPADIDPYQPRMIKDFKKRTIQYTNLKQAKGKFIRILKTFRFQRMDDYVWTLLPTFFPGKAL